MTTQALTQTTIQGMEPFEKPAANGSSALANIIERAAFDPNFDVAKLQALLDMKLRYETEEARRAYIEALHTFRQNAPSILKTKDVSYQQKYMYSHAELDKICDILIPELGKYGLSAGWNSSPAEGGKIRVVCVLTHRQGHRQPESSLDGPPDTTGSKNAVQAIGSTKSYLERYTLLSSLGIAPKGCDNDGRTSESMTEQSIEDYLATIRDASTIEELKVKYEAAKAAASKLSDAGAVKQFLDAKDQRYRKLKGMR
jgi:hypothetical protein